MIYPPSDDSYLLEEEVKKRALGKRVLDVGTGSGIQARAAWRSGAREVLAVDIDEEALEKLKNEEFEVKKSDLLESVYGKFDLIVFNPPYLPEDEREDSESSRVTTGGKRGDEIIIRFLETAKEHLAKNGEILLVISSLTPLDRIRKVLKEKGFHERAIASRRVFMELLEVWSLFCTK
jgi:release factor glutamine methyltransferase